MTIYITTEWFTPGAVTATWFRDNNEIADKWEKYEKKYNMQQNASRFCQQKNGTIIIPEIIVNPKTKKRVKVIKLEMLEKYGIKRVFPKEEIITRNFLSGEVVYVKLSYLEKHKLVPSKK